MTVSHSIILALLGKTVSFDRYIAGRKFAVTGEVQGIYFCQSGGIDFSVNEEIYSITDFDVFDFKIH